MKTKLIVNGVSLELETENALEMQEAIYSALTAVLPKPLIANTQKKEYTHSEAWNATHSKTGGKRYCVICNKGMYRKAKTCSAQCHSKNIGEKIHAHWQRINPERRREIIEARTRGIRATWARRRGITLIDREAIKREWNKD